MLALFRAFALGQRVMPVAGLGDRILAGPEAGALPEALGFTLCSLPLAAMFGMHMPKCCFVEQLQPSFPAY